MRRSLLLRVVLAAVVLALTAGGCAHRSAPPPDFVRVQLAARLRSVAGFPTANFPSADPRRYVGRRTVFLVTSQRPVQLVPNPEGPWAEGPMVVGSSVAPIGIGMGVVIDPRGYILTASHVLGDARLVQAVLAEDSAVRIVPARVVWRGNPRSGDVDLALLFVAGVSSEAYAWSERLTASEPVLGIGESWSGDGQPHGALKFQFYAGHITRWSPGGNGRWQTVTHTAPSFPGDSGGPLLDSQGRLLAVATHGGLRYEGGVSTSAAATAYGTGIHPDPAWVRGLIEADLKMHPLPAGPS